MCPRLATNGESFDQIAFDGISDSGCSRSRDRTLGAYLDLRFNNVFVPISTAGGDVAGQRKSRKSGHRHVVSTADARFQHATAPYGYVIACAYIVNLAGFAMTTNTAQLDIDNSARLELDGRGAIAAVIDALIQA